MMPINTDLKKKTNTREAARLLATRIVVDGEKPTTERIRARLEGKGGQQAIQQGLQDWWEQLGMRLARPDVPEAIWEAVYQLWQAALDRAEASFEKRRDVVAEQLRQAEAERDEILKTLRKQQQQLSENRETVEMLHDQVQEWETQNEGLRDTLDERTETLDKRDADLRQAKEKIASLEPLLAAALESKANTEAAALEYRRRITDLETERQDLGQALAASRVALENERTRHEQATQEANERYQAQEDRWLQEVDSLRQEIKEKARDHKLLNKAFTGEKAKSNELSGQIGKLERENEKLQQALAQTRETGGALVGQKAALELSLAEAREEVVETKTVLARLKQKRADETEAQVGKIIELLNTRLGKS